MRMSTVATGVITAVMSICTLLNIGCAKENTKEIVEANKPKQSISETYIDDREEQDKVKELEEQIEELKRNQTNTGQSTIINNYNTYTDSFNTNNITVQDNYNYENNIDNVQEEVLDSPKTKNPNACEYCKKEGELHKNIRFWYDTNNNIHYTHNKDCTRLYINEYNIQPINEMNI